MSITFSCVAVKHVPRKGVLGCDDGLIGLLVRGRAPRCAAVGRRGCVAGARSSGGVGCGRAEGLGLAGAHAVGGTHVAAA